MRLTILAVGRLKAGPERDLYERYAERIAAAGKGVSLTFTLREFSESRSGSAASRIAEEAAQLAAAVPEGARLVAAATPPAAPTGRRSPQSRPAAMRRAGTAGRSTP